MNVAVQLASFSSFLCPTKHPLPSPRGAHTPVWEPLVYNNTASYSLKMKNISRIIQRSRLINNLM